MTRGTIYKIENIASNPVRGLYIGSTANFNRRYTEHKNEAVGKTSKQARQLLYTHMRENMGWRGYLMTELCSCAKLTAKEMKALEQKYIDELQSNLNTRAASKKKKKVRECRE